jgi:hypothetical protein
LCDTQGRGIFLSFFLTFFFAAGPQQPAEIAPGRALQVAKAERAVGATIHAISIT